MSLSALHHAPLGVVGRPFIDGRFLDSTGLEPTEHVNPSTGQPQASLSLGGKVEIDRAVAGAAVAQKQWMELPTGSRIACFKKLGELLQVNAEQFSMLGARESGIPLSLPTMFLAQSRLDHYLGWIDKVTGTYTDSYPAAGFNYTRREPYGVIGVIIPWNGPLIATCMMVMPAIAAGNAVVLKPPALAPFVALRIAELACAAGMPRGLLNVVPGEAEAGEALVKHPGVGKVSFTGGEGSRSA